MSTQEEAEAAIADMIFPDAPDDKTEEIVEKPEEEVETPEEVEEPEKEREVAPETEGLEEIEIEGTLYEVPQQLKEAFMRNTDYTQKTQEVASQRKELEIQAGNLKLVNGQYEFAQSVQTDIIKAHQIEEQIDQARTYLRDNVATLTHTQIEQIRIGIDDFTINRDKIIQDITTKNTEFQQAREHSMRELSDKSTEVLRQKVPGWGASHETAIKDYALSLGVPEITYNSIVDPLEKEILHKAMQYDALKSGAKPAIQAVQGAPTIQPKSRNPMSKSTQDKLNLRKVLKSGKSAQDKASAIGENLAGRFNM